MLFAIISLLVLLCRLGSCQFVAGNSNLTTSKGFAGYSVRWKQVPTGICELNPNIKSFSGYVDVAPDKHIFFWFFEARNGDPQKAPLTIWLDGGPGSSSLNGMLDSIGPCKIGDNGTVLNNANSWSELSNVIFIDQPVTTGFSYTRAVPAYKDGEQSVRVLLNRTCPSGNFSDTCGTYNDPSANSTDPSTTASAPAFWATLQGFIGVFPQYGRNGINIVSESYGGHFGAVFSQYIQTQNAMNISGATPLDLRTLLLGNGWIDPPTQFESYYNFSVTSSNTYDIPPLAQNVSSVMYSNVYGAGNCLDQLGQCNSVHEVQNDQICAQADQYCLKNVESFFPRFAKQDDYDIRQPAEDDDSDEGDPGPGGNAHAPSASNKGDSTDDPDGAKKSRLLRRRADWVKRRDLKARNADKKQNTSHTGDPVDFYFKRADVQAALGVAVNWSASSDTVDRDFKHTGDDARSFGAIEILQQLVQTGVNLVLYHGDADYNCNWLGGEMVASKIQAPGFESAGFVNVSTSDEIVHGQVKQSGFMSFVRVYDAAHSATEDQPAFTKEMFSRAMNRKDISTGYSDLSPSYRTQGSANSDYREGSSSVDFADANSAQKESKSLTRSSIDKRVVLRKSRRKQANYRIMSPIQSDRHAR